jgi:chemotaxis signal transduction protein
MSSILDSVNQRTQLVGQNRLELLLFRLNSRQRFGINVFKVREVLQCPKLTRMPKLNSLVRGVAHIRGKTISVIDLSMATGGKRIENIESSFIIISEYNRSVQGFLVGSVERIVNTNWDAILPPPQGTGSASYLTAVTEIEDELIELESIEDELVEPESSPSRLPMETRLTDSSFQTLIFEISGVKLAVPLVELGGIHPFVPLQHIIGKPDWYAGFVQLKGKAVNCIDGAKWLLTDKRPSNESTLDYQFIIMLNDTNWGIACHNLVDTVLMFKEEVKWRDTDIKRPWMAGLVKEQMCAMLDTYQLTDMLDAGLSSDQK